MFSDSFRIRISTTPKPDRTIKKTIARVHLGKPSDTIKQPIPLHESSLDRDTSRRISLFVIVESAPLSVEFAQNTKLAKPGDADLRGDASTVISTVSPTGIESTVVGLISIFQFDNSLA